MQSHRSGRGPSPHNPPTGPAAQCQAGCGLWLCPAPQTSAPPHRPWRARTACRAQHRRWRTPALQAWPSSKLARCHHCVWQQQSGQAAGQCSQALGACVRVCMTARGGSVQLHGAGANRMEGRQSVCVPGQGAVPSQEVAKLCPSIQTQGEASKAPPGQTEGCWHQQFKDVLPCTSPDIVHTRTQGWTGVLGLRPAHLPGVTGGCTLHFGGRVVRINVHREPGPLALANWLRGGAPILLAELLLLLHGHHCCHALDGSLLHGHHCCHALDGSLALGTADRVGTTLLRLLLEQHLRAGLKLLLLEHC